MSSCASSPPSPGLPTVGIVGLGRMGTAFAANLMADGHMVWIYDRDQERMAALEAAGAKPAGTLADFVDCQIVLSSLPNDEALANVVFRRHGLAYALRAGAVHVSTSTISPDLSRHLSERHFDFGQHYVAAPVLGNPDLAHARGLFILAAGRPEARNLAMPVLKRLGQRVFIVDDQAETANYVKLAANVLTATTMESLGEVLALMRKVGVDQRVAFEIFTNSLFDAKVHKVYGGKIVDSRFSPPGMTVPLAVKDLRLALAEAERAAVPMPSASVAHDRLIGLMAKNLDHLDWSALGLLAALEAGLGAEEANGHV